MKVLIFMTQIHTPGGAELSSMELAEGLNKRDGIQADLLNIYSEDFPGAAEVKEQLLRNGIPSVQFLGLKPGAVQLHMIKGILKLRKIIRDGHYDIVETSQYGPTILTCWARIGLRARHVGSVRQTFLKSREKGLRGWFFRISVKLSPHARYYAISKDTARHWEKYTGYAQGCTRVVYNSVPDELFEAAPRCREVRKEFGIPDQGRIALSVGRLQKGKGIDTVLDALGPLLETADLYLLYVGEEYPAPGHFPDEEGLLGRMKDRIAQEGWDERVKFLGRRSDVPRLLASSDLLVHPSRTEAFGRILAEAMAAGLPVVASNVEGIPEVLAGTDSIMVPPDDPELLRKAVLETLNRSEAEATRAIARGRERTEAFRIEKRVDTLIELFAELVEGF